MKYLDEGFQYKVYLIEDDKVFKKEILYLVRLFKIFKITRSRKFPFFESIFVAIKSDKKNKKAFKLICKKIKIIDNSLFANPDFTGRNFVQDKVLIVKDVLGSNDNEKNKRLVDKYLEFQKILWSYGIHDDVYKFQQNYGLDKNNNLVCIDFGEFVFDKGEVLKSIKKEKWLKRSSYKNWDNFELKNYYTQKMKEFMTAENLEKYWLKELI